MDDRLQELLGLAYRTAPAAEANSAIAAARDDVPGDAPARSYELALPAGAGSQWLTETATPRLVYHLESTQARPPECGGVIVSLFAGERLYFVRAADFVAWVARLLSLTPEELFARYGTGELRTAVRPPALLGPPAGKPE